MKKLSVIIGMFFTTGVAFGQSFMTSAYVETTSVGPKSGVAIGAVNSYGFEYGGFYQDAKTLDFVFASETKGSQLPRIYERVFFGAYVAAPIYSGSAVDLKLNIRTGVANGEVFVITPSLKGSYQVSRLFSIDAGVGVRAFRPTIQTGFSIRL